MRSNVCNCRRLHMLDKSCPLHADRWRQIVVSSGCRSSTDHSEATVHRHIELVVHFGNRDLLNKTDEIPVFPNSQAENFPRVRNIARPNRQMCRLMKTATVGTTAMGQICSAGKVCKVQHKRRVMRPCCDDKKLFLSPSKF